MAPGVPRPSGASPAAGRLDPGHPTVSPYVVVYRPIEDTIEVLRVLHGAR